jgi:hypothetical protein
MKLILTALSTIIITLSAPALAQGAAGAASSATADEQARATLNREQAEKAQEQLQANAANQEARAKHDQAVQDYEAEKARVAKQYEDEMARWKADVEACKAGKKSHCLQK